MSKLVLYEWPNNPLNLDPEDAYMSSTQVKKFEKVFVYGGATKDNVDKTRYRTYDQANRNIVKKSFGLSETEKRLKMSGDYINSIENGKGGKPKLLNKKIDAISKLNDNISHFFLKNLHDLTWDEFDKGVMSTIPVDEAFNLIKPAFIQLREILMAGIEDKYSSDLTLTEMKNIKQAHDLNVEQSLGKNMKNKKKK